MNEIPETVPTPLAVDRMVQAAVEKLYTSRVVSVDVDEIAALAGIDLEVARRIFPDNDALDEAIGTYGVLRLSDALNKALVTAAEDNRSALIALALAYIWWARDNRELYHVLTAMILQPKHTNSIVLKYDSGFVPLVRRFLGESDDAPTCRAGIARAFLYGMTDLANGTHLKLWMRSGGRPEDEVEAMVVGFIDMLLAAGPAMDARCSEKPDGA